MWIENNEIGKFDQKIRYAGFLESPLGCIAIEKGIDSKRQWNFLFEPCQLT